LSRGFTGLNKSQVSKTRPGQLFNLISNTLEFKGIESWVVDPNHSITNDDGLEFMVSHIFAEYTEGWLTQPTIRTHPKVGYED
jgi:hypothetical protein